ncbi:MAG TPA: hypothetical protein VF773_14995 [Verrucomicrobiae bacterium]
MNTIKNSLAKTPAGRVILHLACLVRDGRLQWHWRGIVREVAD